MPLFDSILRPLEVATRYVSSTQFVIPVAAIAAVIPALFGLYSNNYILLVVGLIVAIAFMFLMYLFHQATKARGRFVRIISTGVIAVVAIVFCAWILVLTSHALAGVPGCIRILNSGVCPNEQEARDRDVNPRNGKKRTCEFKLNDTHVGNGSRFKDVRVGRDLSYVCSGIAPGRTVRAQVTGVFDLEGSGETGDGQISIFVAMELDATHCGGGKQVDEKGGGPPHLRFDFSLTARPSDRTCEIILRHKTSRTVNRGVPSDPSGRGLSATGDAKLVVETVD